MKICGYFNLPPSSLTSLILFLYLFISNLPTTRTQIQGIFETQGSCRVLFSDIMRREFRVINGCIKEMELTKTGPRKKYMMSNCIIKCALIREGLLNDKGLSDNNLLESFMTRVPSYLEKRARNATSTCKSLAEKLDPNEKFCKSYEPLVNCVRGAFLRMCNTR